MKECAQTSNGSIARCLGLDRPRPAFAPALPNWQGSRGLGRAGPDWAMGPTGRPGWARQHKVRSSWPTVGAGVGRGRAGLDEGNRQMSNRQLVTINHDGPGLPGLSGQCRGLKGLMVEWLGLESGSRRWPVPFGRPGCWWLRAVGTSTPSH